VTHIIMARIYWRAEVFACTKLKQIVATTRRVVRDNERKTATFILLLLLSLLFRSLAAVPRVVLNNNTHFVLLLIVMYIIIIILCPFNVRALIETTTTTTTTIITIKGPLQKSLFRYCNVCAYTENENGFARNARRRRYYINIVNIFKERQTDDSKMCEVPAAATELIV